MKSESFPISLSIGKPNPGASLALNSNNKEVNGLESKLNLRKSLSSVHLTSSAVNQKSEVELSSFLLVTK